MSKNGYVVIRRTAIVGLLLWSMGLAAGDTGLEFDDAWIRPTPPGMKMTAGFGRLHNTTTEAIELVSFSSREFGDVTLHRTEIVDGVSRMREVPELNIPAGEAVEMAPGGYHLMLMMPAEPVSEGQVVTVGMESADGRLFSFLIPVKRR